MKTIPILISENNDEVQTLDFKDDFQSKLSSVSHKVVDVSTDAVKSGVAKIIDSFSDILCETKIKNEDYYIDEFEINLNVGAGGEVSILSVSGNANVTSSVKVKIKRKELNCDS